MRVPFLVLLILPSLLLAAPAEPERPRVCLALSGGGARGLTHIGVLQALEELQVPVDCIAGVSMGSIVGGLYASGIGAAVLERIVELIPWEDVLSGELNWSERRLQEKQEMRRYFLGVEIGLGEEAAATPAGILAGQKLKLLLRRLTAGLEVRNFDDLQIPFRAVATDVNEASSYVFSDGDLATAMRASLAIPLVFEPVEHEGRVLVDGGILNNLPVDVARSMGADVVIAVNIASPLGEVRPESSLLQIAYQSIDASLVQNTIQSLASADLVISPALGDISAADFERGNEMIAIGYEAVMDRRRFLDILALDDDRWAELRSIRRPPARTDPPRISYLEFVGNDRTATPRLRARTEELIDQAADPARLEAATNRLMAMESFSSVDYQLVEDEQGRHGVRFIVSEKPWGPRYLRFGLEIESDVEIATDFNLLLNYQRLNLNELGGEWSSGLSIGTSLSVETEWYQPIDLRDRGFVATYLDAKRTPLRLFADSDDQVAKYLVTGARLGMDVGVNWAENRIRAGLFRGLRRGDLEVGSPALPEFDDAEGGWRLRFRHDSLDRPNLAKSGLFADADYVAMRDGLGAETDYQRLDWQALLRYPLGPANTLHLESMGQWIESDDLAPDSAFATLGGLDDLAGYPEGALIGNRALAFRIGSFTELPLLELPLLGTPRIVALAHAGNVWRDEESVDLDELRYGITLGITVDFLGAVLFTGTGYTEEGEPRLYLRVGGGDF